jgi:hypothetical protein
MSEMIRTFIQVPTNQEEWDNLPQEFNDYLDNLNEARIKLSDSQVLFYYTGMI